MSSITLKNDYIHISNSDSMLSYCGGSQKWFQNSKYPNMARQGCGLIAAIDTFLYLSGQNTISYEKYSKIALGYLDKHPFARLFLRETKNGFSIGIIPIQITSFLNKNYKQKTYRFNWNGLSGHEHLYSRMKSMIENNIPVIWSIYNKNGKLPLYKYDSSKSKFVPATTVNNHYVTAIGIVENDDLRMIVVSSWGERYFINFDEYLEFVGASLVSKYCSNIVIAK